MMHMINFSFVGTKAEVVDYIATFDVYGFLWKSDLASEYEAFMATNPTLEV